MADLGEVERIFHEVLERPEPERVAYLQSVTNGDGDLEREVRRLLALDADTAGLLDETPWAPDTGSDALGKRIGAYRLLERIGTGGMGAVWLAERADEQFEHRVAVKLIKRGMDTDDILARFRHERQVLARLEHPNIARLLGGGATEDGRPYVVMEHVQGVPIDTHCREQALSIDDRLRLFRKVCDAVHAAHQNLVVHRDLKPANILVTAEGEPKLLDFGIATMLRADGTPQSLRVTATGERILTPRYASPEQVRGELVDVRSDVYALGVVLFELLTGQAPYGTGKSSRFEIEQAICETEPRRPSTAVETASRRVRRELAGDLDTIVLKTLRKEPAARYASADALGEDVRRYLAGQPLVARPVGVAHRAVKVFRRNRRALTAAVAGGVLASILGAALVVNAFLVPRWVQGHVDRAHLALLDHNLLLSIQTAVWWWELRERPRWDRPKHTIDAGRVPLDAAMAACDAALRWRPWNEAIRLERDTVQLLRDAVGAVGADETLRPTPLMTRAAPLTCDFLERYRSDGVPPTITPEQYDAASTTDLESLGLVTMVLGLPLHTLDAWSRLDAHGEPDPFIEGGMGMMHLALEQPALAYPRLQAMHRAFPDTGFVTTILADAAAQCGDVKRAETLLEASRAVWDDAYGSQDRVRAEMLAASGLEAEADAAFMKLCATGHNVVTAAHFAAYLESRGHVRRAAEVLGWYVVWVQTARRVRRLFIETADRWWDGLDDAGRAATIAEARAETLATPTPLGEMLRAYSRCLAWEAAERNDASELHAYLDDELGTPFGAGLPAGTFCPGRTCSLAGAMREAGVDPWFEGAWAEVRDPRDRVPPPDGP